MDDTQFNIPYMEIEGGVTLEVLMFKYNCSQLDIRLQRDVFVPKALLQLLPLYVLHCNFQNVVIHVNQLGIKGAFLCHFLFSPP